VRPVTDGDVTRIVEGAPRMDNRPFGDGRVSYQLPVKGGDCRLQVNTVR